LLFCQFPLKKVSYFEFKKMQLDTLSYLFLMLDFYNNFLDFVSNSIALAFRGYNIQ